MNSVFKSIVGFLPVGLCTILVTGAILWLTLAPHPLPESDMPVIPGMDKVVHGCMFGGLYFILAFDALLWRIGKKKNHPPSGDGADGCCVCLGLRGFRRWD